VTGDSHTVSPTATTTYVITAIGAEGAVRDEVKVRVEGDVEPLPDGSFGKQYEELIPSDATVESYDPERFSVITGVVKSQAELPLPGVSVMIHSQPEYGTAVTDSDGEYSIPVEGGGTLTLVFTGEDFLKAHRKVRVGWNEIAIAETVMIVTRDPEGSLIEFDGSVATHESTEVTDESGTRSSTMVIPSDTVAYALDPAGNRITLPKIMVRATEYTEEVSMPQELPPNSAFTYCADMTVDNVDRVEFEDNSPIINWVDNFLGFPIGEPVPVGYYDRDQGEWVPYKNGVVVRLLDDDGDDCIDGLDENDDWIADDVDGTGVIGDEVEGLPCDPIKYGHGLTFWRVEVPHFSPWDYNWPYGPPEDSIPPNPPEDSTVDDVLEFSLHDECGRPIALTLPTEVASCTRTFQSLALTSAFTTLAIA